MPLATGEKLGPYEILAPIGAGGMGEVYRAHDPRLGREVAIKVSRERLSERMEREARTIAALNHPHIATLYDVGEHEGSLYLAMEFVRGAPLKGPCEVKEAIGYGIQIAEGLAAAHEAGIVHRDLKPANILVTEKGTVKILDFGLAKLTEKSVDGATAATKTMAIAGTPGYIAPEQLNGKPADSRSDIFAFGCILYELVSGRRAFPGETMAAVLASTALAEPKPLEGAPERLEELIERCLRKDPERRQQSISDARISLQDIRDGAVSTGRPTQPGAASPAQSRRGALGWIVAALAILLAAAVSFLYFRETPPADAALRLSVPLPDKFGVSYLVLSPDGRTVAVAGSFGTRDGLWLRALDSLEPRPLSNTDGARHPFWAPDGRSLGFFADGKLKIIPVAGGPATALCDAGTGGGGAWNREGVILFGGDAGPIQSAIAGGGVPSPVTRAEPGERHRLPVFLPDGRHFLYVVQSTDPSKAGLYVAALNQPAGHRLLPDQSSAIFAPRRKGESHDYLLFQRENTLMAQPFHAETLQLAGDPFAVAPQLSRTSTPWQVAALTAGNGTLVYLAGSSRYAAQPTWLERNGKESGKVGSLGDQRGLALSPDQKSLAVAGNNQQPGLWLRELSRDVETRFTLPPFVGPPVWSQDSVRIAFSGPEGLYVKNASGGQEQLLLRSGNPKCALRLVARWEIPALYGNRSEDSGRYLVSATRPRRQAGRAGRIS